MSTCSCLPWWRKTTYIEPIFINPEVSNIHNPPIINLPAPPALYRVNALTSEKLNQAFERNILTQSPTSITNIKVTPKHNKVFSTDIVSMRTALKGYENE